MHNNNLSVFWLRSCSLMVAAVFTRFSHCGRRFMAEKGPCSSFTL